MDSLEITPLATAVRPVKKRLGYTEQLVIPYAGFFRDGTAAQLGIGLLLTEDPKRDFFVSSQSLRDPVRLYQAMQFVTLADMTRVTPTALLLCVKLICGNESERQSTEYRLMLAELQQFLAHPEQAVCLKRRALEIMPPYKTFVRMCRLLEKASVEIETSVVPKPLTRTYVQLPPVLSASQHLH